MWMKHTGLYYLLRKLHYYLVTLKTPFMIRQ